MIHLQIHKRAVLSAFLMAPALAMAWGAIASNPETGTHIATGHANAAEAEQEAITRCEQKGLPCSILINGSNGGAFVVYVSKGGYHGAFARDPAQADKLAKANCRKNNKVCEIRSAAWDRGAVWLAVAMSDAGSWVRYNNPDPEAVQEQAMADCLSNSSAPKTCKLLGDAAHKGSVAIATSDSAQLSYLKVALDRETAASGALTGCAVLPSKPLDCKVAQQYSNDDPLPSPKAMQALEAQAEKNRAAAMRVKASAPVKSVRSTARTTEHYTCETSCTNASCVSRFDDGTILHWTAQMKHDGFKWALDTSGCGR